MFGFYDLEHVANKADIAKWFYRENAIMKIGPHRISILYYLHKKAARFVFRVISFLKKSNVKSAWKGNQNTQMSWQ